MDFDQALMEKYAMQLEQMLEKVDPTKGGEKSVDIDAVSEALNLDRDKGREYARYLKDEGWVTIIGGVNHYLRLTPKGFAEIAKARRPRLWRWVDKNEARIALVVALLSFVAAVVALFR